MNVGEFMFNLGSWALELAKKLYQAFFMQVDISWIQKVISFFGANIDLPEKISLSYLIGGASAVLILTLIIYRLVK